MLHESHCRITSKSDRIAGILITLSDKPTIIILNVYLLTDLQSITHVSQGYEVWIVMLGMCINRYAYDKLVISGEKRKCKIAWHRISNYDEYVNTMNHITSHSTDIYDLPSLQCTDRNCHRSEIDQVRTLLTDMCIYAADLTLPKVAKRHAIPGWNVDILPLKGTAEFWRLIWHENGRPSTGIVSHIFP